MNGLEIEPRFDRAESPGEYRCVVNAVHDGRALETFVSQFAFPDILPSRRLARIAIHDGALHINDERVGGRGRAVRAGDIVTLLAHSLSLNSPLEEPPPQALPRGCHVAHIDDWATVVYKAPGVGLELQELISCAKDLHSDSTSACHVWPLFMLDKAVSGFVVAARGQKARDSLRKDWRVELTYEAILGEYHASSDLNDALPPSLPPRVWPGGLECSIRELTWSSTDGWLCTVSVTAVVGASATFPAATGSRDQPAAASAPEHVPDLSCGAKAVRRGAQAVGWQVLGNSELCGAHRCARGRGQFLALCAVRATPSTTLRGALEGGAGPSAWRVEEPEPAKFEAQLFALQASSQLLTSNVYNPFNSPGIRRSLTNEFSPRVPIALAISFFTSSVSRQRWMDSNPSRRQCG